jgi:hypothetical protein
MRTLIDEFDERLRNLGLSPTPPEERSLSGAEGLFFGAWARDLLDTLLVERTDTTGGFHSTEITPERSIRPVDYTFWPLSAYALFRCASTDTFREGTSRIQTQCLAKCFVSVLGAAFLSLRNS